MRNEKMHLVRLTLLA